MDPQPIIFLGIIIDTIAGELRLPSDKLERLLRTGWKKHGALERNLNL